MFASHFVLSFWAFSGTRLFCLQCKSVSLSIFFVCSTLYQLALIASISHLSQLANCGGCERRMNRCRGTHTQTHWLPPTHTHAHTHTRSAEKGPLRCISALWLCVWVGFSGEKWYRKKRFSKRFDAGEEMRQHRYTHAHTLQSGTHAHTHRQQLQQSI